jgi:hypothetical protein
MKKRGKVQPGRATRRNTCAALCGCIIITAASLAAQTADTAILGTVTDPAGAIIVGARVTATQPETGVSREAISNAEGLYEVRYLRPGQYIVEFRDAGFRTERLTGIVLQINQQARFDVKLQVGDIVETVEVNSTAPLLQTESAVVGDVIAQQRIVNLPLNNRNFLQLAIMTPGVRIKEESNGERTRVVANGNRDIWMQVNINGITAVNNRAPFVNFYPSVDAIQEFKVQSSNYSAEYGGQSGANINVQLRSGTNDFHGSLFEFLRNNALDARGYFAPAPLPKPVLRRNQFGGVISGPIQKNKLFMMVGYEGVREKRQSASTAIVMPVPMRNGDFSAVTTPIIDPLNRQPFANNMIPRNRLNPVSVNLINTYMPTPNQTGSQNYAGVVEDDLHIDQPLARLDYYLTPKDQVTFHYIYSQRDFPTVSINPAFYQKDRTFPNHSLGIQHVHTFSPSLLNEFRFGFHKGNIRRIGPRTGTGFKIEDLGINGMLVGGPNGRPLRDDEQGFPTINIEGYLGMGEIAASSNIDNSRTYQWVNNLSVIKGRHALKFGGDIRYHLDEATTNNWPFGQLTFNRDISGLGAAAYMLGFPRETLTPEGVPLSDVRNWRFGIYAQDDWKATNRLTLNIGLRWDYFTLPQEKSIVTRFLSFCLPGALRLVPDDPTTFLQPYLPEYNYWGPRFGLAYRISDKTVFRAGYGIFYEEPLFYQYRSPIFRSLPFVDRAVITRPTLPISLASLAGGGVPENELIQYDLGKTYMTQYNVSIQHELRWDSAATLAYIGSRGSNLVGSGDVNIAVPQIVNGRQFFPAGSVRRNPNFGTLRMNLQGFRSEYNGVSLGWVKRQRSGLQVQGSYTYGHSMDNRSGSGGRQEFRNGQARTFDPYNLDLDWGRSDFDVRHNVVLNASYDLPFSGSRFAQGWQISAVGTFASGVPFSPIIPGDSDRDVSTDNVNRPDVVPGVSTKPANGRTPEHWFNTEAFVFPGAGFRGNAGRNILQGPGFATVDLSIVKTQQLSGRRSLQLRLEVFNLLNRANFSTPALAAFSGAADGERPLSSLGRIRSTVTSSRQIQLGLRVSF